MMLKPGLLKNTVCTRSNTERSSNDKLKELMCAHLNKICCNSVVVLEDLSAAILLTQTAEASYSLRINFRIYFSTV